MERDQPQQRSEAVGIFRLWRDLGYAIGALATGLIADQFGITASILAIGAVLASGAGWWSLRGVLQQPVMTVLRRAQ